MTTSPPRHLVLVRADDPPRPQLGHEESTRYQAELLGAWEGQQAILNYSAGTIALNLQTMQDLLAASGTFVWELTREDIDRFFLQLIDRRLSYHTRRRYGAELGTFLDYLRARHSEEIWTRYGVTVPDVIDKYNRQRQRADDRDRALAPPARETVDYFFSWLRQELERCRKWAPVARDYAVFQVLYGVGLRVREAVQLDVSDLHFDLGPMGKLHVRHGKGARGSGPRRRWVPMLAGLDSMLRWYLDDVRPLFPARGNALFVAESGARLTTRSVRGSLRRKLIAAGVAEDRRFSPHGLRRACATYNCEQGLELMAMQQLLGHEYIGTTMAYVQPSETYIERCYEQALERRFGRLGVTVSEVDDDA